MALLSTKHAFYTGLRSYFDFLLTIVPLRTTLTVQDDEEEYECSITTLQKLWLALCCYRR